jgi:Glycosyltransferase family 87
MLFRVILLVVVAFALHLPQLLRANQHYDLFIYRAGAQLALDGYSPYDSAELKRRVVEQYPDEQYLHDNCGFFLAPQAVFLFTPFALLPWAVAKVAWSILCFALLAWAVWRMPHWTDEDRGRNWVWVAAILIAFNPTLQLLMIPAQTTVLALALILIVPPRQLMNHSWRVAWWALTFVKPHIMLPLIPLAGVLFGVRGALRLILAIVVLNLLGLLLTPHRFATVWQYLEHLSNAHKQVVFNRVELNPQITSWNRLLFAFGGPAINLGVGLTLLGYAIWSFAIVVRTWRAPRPISHAWSLAIAVVGAVLCCQVLGYESYLVMAVWPLVWQWSQQSRRVGVVLAVELFVGYLPFVPLAESVPYAEVGMSLRALCVALLAGTLLIVGPPSSRSE